MNLPARILFALLLALGLFVGGMFLFSGEQQRLATPPKWVSSKQCKSCHEEVYKEWEGSHHQIAYLNPDVREISEDFRNKECQACHLPRPVAETGFGRRVLPRMTFPDEGVSCLTCHLSESGGIMGSRDNPNVACAPVRNEDYLSVNLCASCHNQHFTTDQWRKSSYPSKGITCNSCHMPETLRGEATGFDHRFLGAHDKTTLQTAGRFEASFKDNKLVMSLENTGAGHNFPTEERHRAVDMVYRFHLADDSTTDWALGYRFRWPYRDEVGPDTQLPAGEKKAVEVKGPAGARKAEVALWYLLQPYIPHGHEKTTLLYSFELEPGATQTRGIASNPKPRPVLRGSTTRRTADSPAVAKLNEKIRAAPAKPDKKRLTQLRDLMQTAFAPPRGAERLAQKARRSLLEEKDALWILEEGLLHESAGLRSQAAFALAELGSRASVPVLLLRLKYEKDPQVKIWITSTLARLGNHAGLAKLASLTEQGDTAQAAGLTAIDLLKGWGEELGEEPTYEVLRKLLRQYHEHWLAHGVAKGQTATEPGALLTARVAHHLVNMTGFQLRPVDDARFVLQRMGTTSVRLLTEGIASNDRYLRTHCLEVVHDLGRAARPTAKTLLGLLDNKESGPLAARCLGRIGHELARPALQQRLSGFTLEMNMSAAAALGDIGHAEDAESLRTIVKDEKRDMGVRVFAAFGLALIAPDDPDGLPFLTKRKKLGDYHPPTVNELLDRVKKP